MRKVTAVPPDATVHHYDELNEELKEAFPTLVDETEYINNSFAGSPVSCGDYVKSTDYYKVVY